MTGIVEGSLIIMNLITTEASAEQIGRAWLQQNSDRRMPLAVAYLDVEGEMRIAWVREP